MAIIGSDPPWRGSEDKRFVVARPGYRQTPRVRIPVAVQSVPKRRCPELSGGEKGSSREARFISWQCKECSHDKSIRLDQKRLLPPLAIEERAGHGRSHHLDQRHSARTCLRKRSSRMTPPNIRTTQITGNNARVASSSWRPLHARWLRTRSARADGVNCSRPSRLRRLFELKRPTPSAWRGRDSQDRCRARSPRSRRSAALQERARRGALPGDPRCRHRTWWR